jgi:hypothetical protein
MLFNPNCTERLSARHLWRRAKGGCTSGWEAVKSKCAVDVFGGVSSALPFRAIQILRQHGIIVDKYVLSPHSLI